MDLSRFSRAGEQVSIPPMGGGACRAFDSFSTLQSRSSRTSPARGRALQSTPTTKLAQTTVRPRLGGRQTRRPNQAQRCCPDRLAVNILEAPRHRFRSTVSSDRPDVGFGWSAAVEMPAWRIMRRQVRLCPENRPCRRALGRWPVDILPHVESGVLLAPL